MSKRRHAHTDHQTETGPSAADAAATAEQPQAATDVPEFDVKPPVDAPASSPDGSPEPESTSVAPEAAERMALQRERDEAQDKWLRAMAELDNLRKRTRREVADARRFAQADTLRGFLDVLDNLERALQSTVPAADTGAPDPFRDGIELIRQRFRTVLQDLGVTPIEAQGLHLDPLVHEAVGQLPREGAEPGTIIEVAQAGYRLGELVLRPARVIICA
ncbi:MAG: nucleotide exchange factor GrpE [bacterium]|nr:nucleotide exchange factor GrpE [bacterium]